ncbi:MAG: allophanate hydrolase subunit 2 family protein, partial [Nocardioidaceae bacterium]
TEGTLGRLTAQTWTVSAQSNRIGLRLEGTALERSRTEEMPSEGLVLGAVQVPASGQPLVFLNDHPTTGGYPVVGVVGPEDLAVCAQLRPGSTVRLVV